MTMRELSRVPIEDAPLALLQTDFDVSSCDRSLDKMAIRD